MQSEEFSQNGLLLLGNRTDCHYQSLLPIEENKENYIFEKEEEIGKTVKDAGQSTIADSIEQSVNTKQIYLYETVLDPKTFKSTESLVPAEFEHDEEAELTSRWCVDSSGAKELSSGKTSSDQKNKSSEKAGNKETSVISRSLLSPGTAGASGGGGAGGGEENDENQKKKKTPDDKVVSITEDNTKIFESEVLGKGGAAIVYRGLFKGHPCAVKTVRYMTDKSKNLLKREYQALNRLKHQNIIDFYHFDTELETIYMELLGCEDEPNIRDVQEWASKRESETQNPIAKIDVMLQIASGLQYLHDNNVTHCDMKPTNVLMKGTIETPVIKITDYGNAYYSAANTSLTQTGMKRVKGGTPLYAGPEHFNYKVISTTRENDIYMLGLTMTMVLYPLRDGPYEGVIAEPNEACLGEAKRAGELPVFSVPKNFTEEEFKVIKSLLEKCLRVDDRDRCTIQEVIGVLETELNKLKKIYEEKSSSKSSEIEAEAGIQSYRFVANPKKKLMEADKTLFCDKSFDIPKPSASSQNEPEKDETVIFSSKAREQVQMSAEMYERSENPLILRTVTDLKMSQSSPGELCLDPSMRNLDIDIPSYKTFNVLKTHMSQQEAYDLYNADNCCAFLSMEIADKYLLKGMTSLMISLS